MGIKIIGWVILWLWAATACTGGSAVPENGGGRTEPQNPASEDAIASPSPLPAESSATLTLTPGEAVPEFKFEPDLVWIPAGTFEMGADAQAGYQVCIASRSGCRLEDFLDETPQHMVRLGGYWIYTYEVTNAEYQLCVAAGECSEPVFTEFYHNPVYSEHPVVYLDWYSASRFCQWAGGRLPTEAEWEMAARGSTGWIFPWGDEPDCTRANYSGCNYGEVTMPVGSYPLGASVFGVEDMAGNAAEWVADWYDPEYYAGSAIENPAGPQGGELKTARGGSWKNPAVGVRTTNRSSNYPEVYSSGVGFRCVVDGE